MMKSTLVLAISALLCGACGMDPGEGDPTGSWRDMFNDEFQQSQAQLEFKLYYYPAIYATPSQALYVRRCRIGTVDCSNILLPKQGTNPAFIADHSIIAYVRGGDIFLNTVLGDQEARITDTGNNNYPSFSPDGNRLLYTVASQGGQYLSLMDLESWEETGLLCSVAYSPATIVSPHFSPDQKWIVASYQNGTSNVIKKIDLVWALLDPFGEQGDHSAVINTNGSDPAFNPTGTRIAFSRKTASGQDDIYVMQASGSGVTRLTSSLDLDTTPTWDAGGRIVFKRRKTSTGPTRIMAMLPDGSGLSEQFATTATDFAGFDF